MCFSMIVFLVMCFLLINNNFCFSYNSDVDLTINDENHENNTVVENHKVFRKCCPKDQGLSRLITNNSVIYYDCIDPIDPNENIIFNTTLKYPLGSFKLITPQSKVIVGFPSECDAEEYSESQLTSINAMPNDSCVDKLYAEVTSSSREIGNGTFLVISCNEQNQRLEFIYPPKLRPITKCCVGNKVFDVNKNICVNSNSSESIDFFSSLVNSFPRNFDIFNIKYGSPNCENPNVMFRYSSTNYEFKFYGNNLSLKKGSKQIFFEEGNFCVDHTLEGYLVARSCKGRCSDGDICVTKCCPEGQVYMYPNNKCGSRAYCGLNSEWGFSPVFHNISDFLKPEIANTPEVFGIQYKENCKFGKYILNPNNKNDKNFLDVENGKIILPKMPNPFDHKYCMEIVDSPCPHRQKIMYYFICFPPPVQGVEKVTLRMRIFSVGLVISCVFLAATFIVYFFLPALQNLHGRIIMCYVVAMLIAYCCLTRVQWPVTPDSMHCRALGYMVYFSFMVAFSWLNVMCFDIWLTFGNTRSIQLTKQKWKELKKLLMFSLYAFIYPLTLTSIVFLLDKYNVMEGVLDANIGKSQCWFNTVTHRKPFLILFILPAGLQIASNIILFILTAIHCNKVKSEIHRMQTSSMGERCKKRFMADKAMYVMNLKLFIVMGVTWMMEIISALYGDVEALWFIPDLFNVLQGIPIFCILVLKKKVYRLIRKRLGLEQGIRSRNDTSGVTSSTGISRTSCSEVMTKKHLSFDSSSIPLTNGK